MPDNIQARKQISDFNNRVSTALDKISAQTGRSQMQLLNVINDRLKELVEPFQKVIEENVRLFEENIKLKSENESMKKELEKIGEKQKTESKKAETKSA